MDERNVAWGARGRRFESFHTTNKIKDLASKGAKSFSFFVVTRKFSHTFSHTASIAGFMSANQYQLETPWPSEISALKLASALRTCSKSFE